MKNYFSIKNNAIAAMAFFALLVTSCTMGPSATDTIPSNSQIVGSVDLMSLAKKGDLAHWEDLNSMKAVSSALDNESKELKEMWNEVLANPENTGIDLSKDVYFFMVNDNASEQYSGLTFLLKDEAKFRSLLEKLGKESNDALIIDQVNGHNVVKVSPEVIMSWNQTHFLVLAATNYVSRSILEEKSDRLLSLEKSNSVNDISSFKQFVKDSKDINIWLSGSSLKPFISKMPQYAGMAFSLDECAFTGYLDFKDGEITIDSKAYYSSQVIKDFNLDKDMVFDKDLFKTVPKDNFVMMGLTLDMDMFESSMKKESAFEMIDQQCQKQCGVDFSTALKSFNPSMLLTLSDVNQIEIGRYGRKSTMPELNLAMSLNSAEDHQWLKDLLAKHTQYSNNGYYQLTVSEGIDVYFDLNDHHLVITNSEHNIKIATGKSTAPSFDDSKLVLHFQKTPYFIYLDADYNHFTESMKAVIENEFPPYQRDFISGDKAIFKDAEITMLDNTVGSLSIRMKDKDENSLKQIITLVDDNIAQLGMGL